jgi:hypothetical protein
MTPEELIENEAYELIYNSMDKDSVESRRIIWLLGIQHDLKLSDKMNRSD